MFSKDINYEFIKEHSSNENGAILGRISQSDFWDDYDLRATIHSVTLKDGTHISNDDINKVPETVRNYFSNHDEDSETQMIVDQIDKNFIGAKQYAFDALQKALQERDPVCYELVERVNSGRGRIQRGFSTY